MDGGVGDVVKNSLARYVRVFTPRLSLRTIAIIMMIEGWKRQRGFPTPPQPTEPTYKVYRYTRTSISIPREFVSHLTIYLKRKVVLSNSRFMPPLWREEKNIMGVIRCRLLLYLFSFYTITNCFINSIIQMERERWWRTGRGESDAPETEKEPDG